MIEVRLSSDRAVLKNADILVMPAFAGPHGPEFADAGLSGSSAHGQSVAMLRRDGLFKGTSGQLSALLVPSQDGPAVLAVGVGSREAFTANILREALMPAAHFLRDRGRRKLA